MHGIHPSWYAQQYSLREKHEGMNGISAGTFSPSWLEEDQSLNATHRYRQDRPDRPRLAQSRALAGILPDGGRWQPYLRGHQWDRGNEEKRMIVVRSGGCCCLFTLMGILVSSSLIPVAVAAGFRKVRQHSQSLLSV